MDFSVSTALEFAQAGQIEDWVYEYLTSGNWANLGLANGLRLQRRWWLGPISVHLSDLVRVCGPEAGMEYQVSAEPWEIKISRLTENLTDPLLVPPLIIEYRSGSLSIRDGNHRHEAMHRKGWLNCWVLIWHNSEEDYRSNPYRIESL